MSHQSKALLELSLMRLLISTAIADIAVGEATPDTADKLLATREQLTSGLRWAIYTPQIIYGVEAIA